MPMVETRAASMFYEQFGEGPDIVWVAGGGGRGADWHDYQIPYFQDSFRNTTFDNRGLGETKCDAPYPWSIADMADDAAQLIEAVCNPPVVCVGLSMGSFIVQQLAVDHPQVMRAGIVMGTAAKATGWLYDYMQAEIDWRKAGNALSGAMSTIHYASMLYPSSALSDDTIWARVQAMLGSDFDVANEESLIPQWQACNDYDIREGLAACRVPLHVIAFEQDIQAPARWGREVAELAPESTFDLFPDMGHCSVFGHTHEVLNPFIESLVSKYF